jgi:hypothetical protein
MLKLPKFASDKAEPPMVPRPAPVLPPADEQLEL